MSEGISFTIPPSRDQVQLPPFLTSVSDPEHVLRVQTEPRLPSNSSSRRKVQGRGQVKKPNGQIVAIGSRPSRPPSSFWGNLLVGGMSVAIMAMSLSALMGADPTSPKIPSSPAQVSGDII